MRPRTLATALVLAALAGGGATANAVTGRQTAGAAGGWATEVDNPYFPLAPGTTWVYRGSRDGAPTRDVVTVTDRTLTIQGAPATVVHDDLYVSGRLFETTDDYYAQDSEGTVHYLGEDTKELDKHGRVVSTEGSFRAGVDGAQGGIIMLAHPHVGDAYQQEFYAGHAEDQAKVLSVSATVAVPFGTFHPAVRTEETTPLEPAVVENKWYAKGIGEVRAEDVQGGSDFDELVSMTKRNDGSGGGRRGG